MQDSLRGSSGLARSPNPARCRPCKPRRPRVRCGSPPVPARLSAPWAVGGPGLTLHAKPAPSGCSQQAESTGRDLGFFTSPVRLRGRCRPPRPTTPHPAPPLSSIARTPGGSSPPRSPPCGPSAHRGATRVSRIAIRMARVAGGIAAAESPLWQWTGKKRWGLPCLPRKTGDIGDKAL